MDNIINDLNTFTAPDALAKPEIRWWLAGGSHTDETLTECLDDICSMGFGGVEVLTMAEDAMDKSVYGWDSPAWYDSTKFLLEETNRQGLAFSFTSGPNWQPAVPGLDLDSNAPAQELNFNAFTLEAGQTYNAPLEPYDLHQDADPRSPFIPRKQHFFKAIAAKLADRSANAEITLGKARNAGLFPRPGSEFDTVYLAEGSAIDLTGLVTGEDHVLNWTAPQEGRYVVFTFWYHATAQQAMASHEPAFVINHIDKAGFEAQRAYWDQHFFTSELQKLITKNGRVNFFQDSLEITTSQYSGLYWSESFMEEFKARRGYDLSLLLPMVIQYNIGFLTCWITKEAEKPRYLFEGWEEKRKKLIRDVYQTQTELYKENYLDPIRQWLNSHDIKLRAQTAYGFATVAFEVSQPVAGVDIHETETLEMADEVDYYRTQSGAVHLTGKNVFSAETGATNGGNYYLAPADYLTKIHKLFAGGINRVILHGYASKAGPEGAIQWPGYEALFVDTSERFGSRHPYGKDMPSITAYIQRMQTLLRKGQVKMDVGILNLAYTSVNMDFWYGFTRDPENHRSDVFAWADRSLNDAGYTYEFFAPQYLEDTAIACENGLFDAGRTDYRALIVNQDILPLSSAEALLKKAKTGLPVVLLEGSASTSAYLGDDQTRLEAIVAQLKALPNVAVASSQAEAPKKLLELGVRPRTQLAPERPLMLLHREEGEYGILYVFNPTCEAQTTTISLEGDRRPFAFNGWTGKTEEAAAEYCSGSTQMAVSLAPYTAQLFILTQGRSEAVSEKPLGPVEVSWEPWQLNAQLWSPGEKQQRTQGSKAEVWYDTAKTSQELTLSRLQSWKELPQLGSTASGVGCYESTFTLPDTWQQGQRLILAIEAGPGTVSAEINGQAAEVMDLNHMRADISALARPGANRIKLTVCTTLYNQLLSQGRVKADARVSPSITTGLCDYGLLNVTMLG